MRNTYFVHIPRTGGTSVSECLIQPYLISSPTQKALNNVIRRRSMFMINSELSMVIRGDGHVNISEEFYRDSTSDKYCFTFVRNPWSRTVSLYEFFRTDLWWSDGGEDKSDYPFMDCIKTMTFAEYIHYIQQTKPLRTTQASYLTDTQGKLYPTFIGKYENLQNDFNIVCKELNLPEHQLPVLLKTNRKPYSYYYSPDTKKVVEEIYQEDIDRFKYQFRDVSQ